MKNIKLIWQIMAVVTLCTCFTGCGDDDEDKEGIAFFTDIYGAWYLEEYETWNGIQHYCYEVWVFREDGTYTHYDCVEEDDHSYHTFTTENSFSYDSSKKILSITDRKDGKLDFEVKYHNDKIELIAIGDLNDWEFPLMTHYNGQLPPPEGKLFENNNQNNNDDQNDDEQETLTTIDGFKFVDLGLSVKWAASNLNGYYQYGNPSANDFKTEYGLPTTEIGGTSDDPAYANMSNKWRLPTRTEMQELVNNCTWEYTYDNGSGFRVTGPNGNSIFLTCEGAYPLGNESSLLYYGYQCWLMTSTLDNSGNKRPYILKASYINSYTSPTVTITTNEAYRISGMSVRGVSIADPDVRNK
ncbi:hypothetical protein L6472_11000 [Prevotella sp. E13-17]|uniref:hypothetical protein n=1 Tax=Prevotella sp. E13-17 TaxID=2913616 RepID=UPI001EDC2731|nr:hypothetical protein [Prevotella sp. E13-17]UKK50545.1 hypothetical protein L6472_11000 [Prevotella sp. E13-17]